MKADKKSQSVLIVDDDQHVLAVLDARLSNSGLDVYQANGGRKALEILKGHRIDLVVSDVKMPEMDGMALLSEIIQTQPGLPVIFLTARRKELDEVLGMPMFLTRSKRSKPAPWITSKSHLTAKP